ncbi:MAG: signal peptidase I [Candidatus Omnitrophica bacterium]|nr:signal peptidase I [Candidatus Omnitrophota bacterium]
MNQKTKFIIREYVESFVIALVLALIIRTFVIQAFKIPTGSMNPTLKEGDRILVSKFIYKFRKPESAEVVVFKYPENPKTAYIKRLIAKPLENVEIKNGRIYINAEEKTDMRLSGNFYYNRGPYGDVGQIVKVPENFYYVLGDNSANSRDSRFWGFVPENNLIGKALVIYWPLHRMRIIE